MTSLQPLKYDIIKAVIGAEPIFRDCNNHHVYAIRENGTSDLLGVFKYRKDALWYREYLSSHSSAGVAVLDEVDMILQKELKEYITHWLQQDGYSALCFVECELKKLRSQHQREREQG
jgi:hypothetical protein